MARQWWDTDKFKEPNQPIKSDGVRRNLPRRFLRSVHGDCLSTASLRQRLEFVLWCGWINLNAVWLPNKKQSFGRFWTSRPNLLRYTDPIGNVSTSTALDSITWA